MFIAHDWITPVTGSRQSSRSIPIIPSPLRMNPIPLLRFVAAALAVSKSVQWLEFVLDALRPLIWVGTLVHFLPFQLHFQRIHLSISFSLCAMLSKFISCFGSIAEVR